MTCEIELIIDENNRNIHANTGIELHQKIK